MTGSWRVRCRVGECRWRSKGAGPASLGLDALHAHVNVVHPVTP